jgi:phosphate transport system permease protein
MRVGRESGEMAFEGGGTVNGLPEKRNEALEAALKGRTRVRVLGLNFDDVVRVFFGGNATVAVVVLGLILVFLSREGLGFFRQNQTNLRVYRQAGLEYVDLMRRPLEEFTGLTRRFNEVRLEEFKALLARGVSEEEAAQRLEVWDAFGSKLSSAAGEARGMVSDLTEAASAIKTRIQVNVDREEQRRMLRRAGKEAEAAAVPMDPIDLDRELKVLTGTLPGWRAAVGGFSKRLGEAISEARESEWGRRNERVGRLLDSLELFAGALERVEGQLAKWRWQEPVSLWRSISTFLIGREWITASFWQDWYGILPLFFGSLLASGIALVLAVPLAISAAIYISEVASPREKAFLKPYIEFISAIPSVVLGFFGIAVLGTVLRSVSELAWLGWVPGFPMLERLNALTAGCLLALTSIPTIFSLAEDAISNVPKHFKEASYALGATRLQTLVRVLIPASLSGIISAVLLGFGRVIGETMVVLLCAGNRIKIPDFSQGLGVAFEPVHTMTGIIAQEMGEVAQGSIHYRALFMVGVMIFLMALGINFLAQKVVRRYRISIG